MKVGHELVQKKQAALKCKRFNALLVFPGIGEYGRFVAGLFYGYGHG